MSVQLPEALRPRVARPDDVVVWLLFYFVSHWIFPTIRGPYLLERRPVFGAGT
jgi:hypothetical protein